MQKKKIMERGITIIALIVTIVVLLIIAGITISAVKGNNSIINKSKTTSNEYNLKSAEEKGISILYEYKMDKAKDDNLTFEDFLKKEEINYNKNNDGTTDLYIDDYIVVVDKDDTTIIKTIKNDKETLISGSITNSFYNKNNFPAFDTTMAKNYYFGKNGNAFYGYNFDDGKHQMTLIDEDAKDGNNYLTSTWGSSWTDQNAGSLKSSLNSWTNSYYSNEKNFSACSNLYTLLGEEFKKITNLGIELYKNAGNSAIYTMDFAQVGSAYNYTYDDYSNSQTITQSGQIGFEYKNSPFVVNANNYSRVYRDNEPWIMNSYKNNTWVSVSSPYTIGERKFYNASIHVTNVFVDGREYNVLDHYEYGTPDVYYMNAYQYEIKGKTAPETKTATGHTLSYGKYIGSNGIAENENKSNGTLRVVPIVDINLDKVLYTKSSEQGNDTGSSFKSAKDAKVAEYSGDNINFVVNSGKSAKFTFNDTDMSSKILNNATLNKDYTFVCKDENSSIVSGTQYIKGLIFDNNNKILGYGNLGTISNGGTANFNVNFPSSIMNNGKSYYVALFVENVSSTSNATSYATNPTVFKINVR